MNSGYEDRLVSVTCPCCFVDLCFPDEHLPDPSVFSEELKELGWWFSCGKCNCHWWHAVEKDSKETIDQERKAGCIKELNRILSEFEVPEKFSKEDKEEPQNSILYNNEATKENSMSINTISDELLESIRGQLLKEIKQEVDEYTQIRLQEVTKIEKKKRWFNKEGKVGTDFFPKKIITDKKKFKKEVEVSEYSYKRVLPNYFSNNLETGSKCYTEALELDDNLNKKKVVKKKTKYTFPSFFKKKQKAPKTTEKWEEEKEAETEITEEENNFQRKEELASSPPNFPKLTNEKQNFFSNIFSKIDMKIGIDEENCTKTDPKKETEIYIPSRLKKILKSNLESRLLRKNEVCFAIAKNEEPAELVPFLPYDDFDNEDFESDNELVLRKTSSRLKVILLLLFAVFIFSTTIFIIQHKNTLANFWRNSYFLKNSTVSNNLILEKVTYSIYKEGKTNKILVLGEIFNQSDFSTPLPGIKISVYRSGFSSPSFFWKYKHFSKIILPNEHILFKTEKEVGYELEPETKVEVSVE